MAGGDGQKVKSFVESGLLIMMCLIADLWDHANYEREAESGSLGPPCYGNSHSGGWFTVTAMTQSAPITSRLL